MRADIILAETKPTLEEASQAVIDIIVSEKRAQKGEIEKCSYPAKR